MAEIGGVQFTPLALYVDQASLLAYRCQCSQDRFH
jgi:hypothetical protein